MRNFAECRARSQRRWQALQPKFASPEGVKLKSQVHDTADGPELFTHFALDLQL
jgi:hypothetical protein